VGVGEGHSKGHGIRQNMAGRIAHQLHKERLWLYLAILVGMVILYCVLFWHLPLSEDAGFYGYLSRAVANGMTLHRDICLSSTNSMGIYVTALVFKIAGASFDLYRLAHAMGLFFLVLTVYFVASKDARYGRGLLAASLAGVFCVLPHTVLDLGRNYIVWATGFVLAGVAVQSSDIKRKEIFSGVLLGMAALIRETFVLAGIGLFVCEIGRLLFHKGERREASSAALLVFGAAFVLTLSLNAVILTYYGTWDGYFRDMLQSGTAFRYESGLLDPDRIADNLSQLRYGFNHYYYPVLLLAGFSYFFAAKDRFVSYLQYLLIPVFIVEAVVVNRTSEYSIIPIMVFASILTGYFLFELKDRLTRSGRLRVLTLKVATLTLAVLFLAVGIVDCGVSTLVQFRDYYHVAREMHNTKLADSSEHTSRILYAASLLPNDTVSTVSEYPFLFLADKFYGTNPFVEDLTASANLNRPDLWEAQLDYLKRTPTDLLISKTTNSYLSKWTDLGQIIDKNYIMVCDFPFAAGSTAYKERILLSRDAFDACYTLRDEETAEAPFEGFNDLDEAIIVSVITSVPEDIGLYCISTKLSKTQYAEEYTSDLAAFSLVAPQSGFKIESPTETSLMNRQFQIRYYTRNEHE
jgi:hypothetical protein